jgi:hypothetical protein
MDGKGLICRAPKRAIAPNMLSQDSLMPSIRIHSVRKPKRYQASGCRRQVVDAFARELYCLPTQLTITLAIEVNRLI